MRNLIYAWKKELRDNAAGVSEETRPPTDKDAMERLMDIRAAACSPAASGCVPPRILVAIESSKKNRPAVLRTPPGAKIGLRTLNVALSES